jgi:hypothetical protein
MSRVGKTKFGAEMEIPGPGSYSTVTDQRGSGFLGDAPGFTMGARKAVAKPDDASPGPVYSPRVITPRSHGAIGDAAQYSFGASKRWENSATGDPGPGQYAQMSTRTGGALMGDAAMYSFGTSSQRPSGDFKKGQRYAKSLCSANFPSIGHTVRARAGHSNQPFCTFIELTNLVVLCCCYCRFISKEHALKANFAAHSPGPSVYNVQVRTFFLLACLDSALRFTSLKRGRCTAGHGIHAPGLISVVS